MTTEEQLQDLRFKWVLAKKKNDTGSMRIIEMRAKLLKSKGLEIIKPSVDVFREAEEIFGVR